MNVNTPALRAAARDHTMTASQYAVVYASEARRIARRERLHRLGIHAAIQARRYPGDCDRCARLDYAMMRPGLPGLLARIASASTRLMPGNDGGHCRTCILCQGYAWVTHTSHR